MSTTLKSLEKRTERLEDKTDKLDRALLELAEQMKTLAYIFMKTEREMHEFREEMRVYRDQKEREMEQKEKEMQEFREEWRAYREQKEKEMQEFRERMEKQIKEMNKKWGDLVNKWGTMVEDIIVPGIPFALERRFGLKVKDISPYRTKRLDGEEREYDALVIAGDYIFVFFVKSKFRSQHFEEVKEALEEFFKFFPEYKDLKLIPVIAAFNFDKGTVNTATKKGILALQMSGDYLDFVNADKIKLP